MRLKSRLIHKKGQLFLCCFVKIVHFLEIKAAMEPHRFVFAFKGKLTAYSTVTNRQRRKRRCHNASSWRVERVRFQIINYFTSFLQQKANPPKKTKTRARKKKRTKKTSPRKRSSVEDRKHVLVCVSSCPCSLPS